MRIRKVFLLSLALGSAVGVMCAMLFASQQWSASQVAEGVELDTRFLITALRLPETMNIERAFINARLIEPTAGTPEQMSVIQRQTDLVDATVSRALQRADTPADSEALRALVDKLQRVRQVALPAIEEPRAARSADVVDRYLNDMFAVQQAAFVLASAVQQRISANSSSIGRDTRLALLAWEMRDWSGRQTTTLISYIGLRLPMSGEQAETLAVFKGHIDQTWLKMTTTAAEMNRADIAAALAKVQDGFWAHGGEAYATWVLSNRGQPLKLDPDRFVTFIRPILDTILPVRDSALVEALRESKAQVAVLRVHLLVALFLLLLTACAAVFASWWFDRRVLRPTAQITGTILALASGKRDLDVPLQRRTDELGQMARATETLRRNAIEAEAAQQARAEEKSRLLAELTHQNRKLVTLNHDLEVLATTDALTGVYNRQTFHIRLQEKVGTTQQDDGIAVHCIDLDLFKCVNDTFGHPTGDVLLEKVGQRLRSCVRQADVVARLGGDEFAILQCATTAEQAGDLAARVLAALCAPYDLDGRRVVVGASIGIAFDGDCLLDSERLLSNADLALYRCKVSGRGTFRFFESSMELEEKKRYEIKHDLREALPGRQLRIHYQPLFNMELNRISGYEALLRWEHPERGMVMPGNFIPVAEESGLITPIGEWILHEACRDAAKWVMPVKVAINLSPVQFCSDGLVQAVRSALQTSGLLPERLELEITESVLLQNDDRVVGILHELRGLGVRMVLDDFGTGYSSLSYLRNFPFDKIKIDRSFVRDMGTQPGCLAILQSVCDLAGKLGMTTTAEGVEAEEQLQQLRLIGFTEAQGYLLGRPAPNSVNHRLAGGEWSQIGCEYNRATTRAPWTAVTTGSATAPVDNGTLLPSLVQ